MARSDVGGIEGEHLGRLRVGSLLGSGGMGEVYEAYDELLDRPVAIKMLRGDRRLSEDARARFLREARLLSRLDHPNICRLYDLIERDGEEALVLELVPGESLQSRLQAGPLETEEALRITIGVAEGLAAAHAAGVVHRDLKPANVMILPDGGVKLLDFGIARSNRVGSVPPGTAGVTKARAPLWETQRGGTVGTVAYMSPEQARGLEVTTASDLYSFGVLLRELATGCPTYAASSRTELLARVMQADIEPVSVGLDDELSALLDEMLSVNPAKRPLAAAVATRLRIVRDRPERRRRRRRRLASGGVAIAVLASLLWFAYRNFRPAPLFLGGEAPRLAVLPFENATAEARFRWVERGLAELVALTVASTGEVDVIPVDEVLAVIDRTGSGAEGGDGPDSAKMEQAVRSLGATVALGARIEVGPSGEDFRIVYRPLRPGLMTRERSFLVRDLVVGANELAGRMVRRLAPDSLLPDLFESLSSDPLANRLYAMGLQRLREDLAPGAEPLFRAALELDPELGEAAVRLATAQVRQAAMG